MKHYFCSYLLPIGISDVLLISIGEALKSAKPGTFAPVIQRPVVFIVRRRYVRLLYRTNVRAWAGGTGPARAGDYKTDVWCRRRRRCRRRKSGKKRARLIRFRVAYRECDDKHDYYTRVISSGENREISPPHFHGANRVKAAAATGPVRRRRWARKFRGGEGVPSRIASHRTVTFRGKPGRRTAD